MTFSPEKTPLPSGTIEEEYKKEIPPGTMEYRERIPKSTKAMIAIGLAVLWGEWKFLDRGPLGGELKKEDEKSIEEKGWIRTMADKASKYYKNTGKVEGAVFENKWDELFGADKESPEKKEAEEGK